MAISAKGILTDPVSEPEQTHETQEVKKAQDVIDKIRFVAFTIDFMKDPEDAIVFRKITKKGKDVTGLVYEKWSENHFERIIGDVARMTGADPEQLRDPKKRTPEQQQALSKASAAEQALRMEIFFKSRYYQAFDFLESIEGKYHDPHENDIAYIDTKEQAILYFFATHEDIKPNDIEPLTDESKEELKAIFYRLDAFYLDNPCKEGSSDAEGIAAFYNFIEKEIQPKPRKKEDAENNGAITTIAERLFLPSDPEYQDAFITKIGNSSIGLFKRDAEKGKKELALDIDMPFVRALAKAIFIDALNKGITSPSDIVDGKQGETGIYIPTIATELGHNLSEKKDKDDKKKDKDDKKKDEDDEKKDEDDENQNSPSRAESRQRFINSLIVKLDNIWGKLPKDTTEYKLISVNAYNPETEILYFTSPYLQKLIAALIGKEAEKIESGYHYYNWQCDLLHSTAANERSPAAVEMATRILVGLQQRGLKPESKLKQNKGKTFTDETEIIYKITCKRLIQDCPQIREKLKAQKTASLKTQTIKRTFAAMYRILKKKTDLFTYYADVTLTEAIPTSKTLDTEIIITHHGRNPKYNKPFLPLLDDETVADT